MLKNKEGATASQGRFSREPNEAQAPGINLLQATGFGSVPSAPINSSPSCFSLPHLSLSFFPSPSLPQPEKQFSEGEKEAPGWAVRPEQSA